MGSPRRHLTADASDTAGCQSSAKDLDSFNFSSLKYSLDFLLQSREGFAQKRLEQSEPISAEFILDPPHKGSGASPSTIVVGADVPKCHVPEDPINRGTFPYASLPFELRQMVLRELVPTKSIWNGTSFPKSCPKGYQRSYFERTKYLQNRALAH
ncbi:hypothetical protein N8I77_000813 [Diaporthe amygdali]|uniref:Uncharacterized protein n=1 Tax=Phomopsis amygdali TaxID=1214568 RepID=A0AAD9SQD7_PHOAM|nr:hypothetical protein N8I77_000813 [Diaporthe amygdali]